MFNKSTDKEWEKFGSSNPYFGVLTDSIYLTDNITDERKQQFFNTGANYIEHVIETIRKNIDPGFSPANSLDFGCGVARLVIPLSKISQKVVGVDVSDSMITESKRNCELHSIGNASFFNSVDELIGSNFMFDFVHSFIVFQHIPVRKGVNIFKKILSLMEIDSIGVVHFTYAYEAGRERHLKVSSLVKKYIPFSTEIINLFKGKTVSFPTLQMNRYSLNKLFRMLQEINVQNVFFEFTNHGGTLGILIYFKKSSNIDNSLFTE